MRRDGVLELLEILEMPAQHEKVRSRRILRRRRGPLACDSRDRRGRHATENDPRDHREEYPHLTDYNDLTGPEDANGV